MSDLGLIKYFQETGCIKTRNILVESNLGLVHMRLNKHHRMSGIKDDLFQEGVLGLMMALDRFDISKEVKFSTYAYFYVRLFMTRCVYRNASIIQCISGSDNKRKIYSRLHKLVDLRGIRELSHNMVTQFCEENELSYSEVLDLIGVLGTDNGESSEEICRALNPEQLAQESEAVDRLISALNTLKVDQLKIINYRFYSEDTFTEIGSKMGCSHSSIQQRLNRIYDKMREVLV